jgi:NAD(P)-dependent dehydrogenase (short-subunit alcohol dehydrogenase family)/acyl carrier protein
LRAFPAEGIHDAFRFMAQARHIGKVVITHRPQHPGVRSDGAYLVTGGLGGLGLAVARHLVDGGADHVILIGRRPPSADASETVAELERSGATVAVLQADVADATDVRRVIETISATGIPLRGVLHAAGVTDDGAIVQQTWERFERVLAPKVDGARLLHEATRTLDLDHFVLFSSASALFGAPGQSNYVAANNALDALAHERRAVGLPGLSVNWGPWAEVGMAARLDEREAAQLAAGGFAALDQATALDALDRLISEDATQAAVIALDWPTLLAAYPPDAVPPLLSEIAQATPSGADQYTPSGERFGDLLDAAEPEERRGLVDDYVAAQLVRVLRLDPSQPIDADEGLTDIGMDSLMAVELSNRMRADLGLSLPATLAFEYPTQRALGEYLAGELLGEAAVPIAGRSSRPPSDDAPPLEEVSDDELVDRLLEELDESGY